MFIKMGKRTSCSSRRSYIFVTLLFELSLVYYLGLNVRIQKFDPLVVPVVFFSLQNRISDWRDPWLNVLNLLLETLPC